MGGIDDEDVDLRVDERGWPLERVGPDADRGADAKASVVVLRRVGEVDALLDVLHRDQARQAPVGIDERELLDPVAAEDRLRLFMGRPDRRGDEIRARRDG